MIDHPLYQCVVDEPDNDDPRLLFADMMDELGDPWGDFIRLQIRLAGVLTAADRDQLQVVEREMLARYRRLWNAPIHRYLGKELGLQATRRRAPIRFWGYTRGFLSKLSVDASTYMTRHPQLSRIGPIQDIRFFGLEKVHKAIFLSPSVAQLRSLSFVKDFPYHLDRPLLQAIATSPYLSKLELLDLSHVSIAPESARLLADSEALGNVQNVLIQSCAMNDSSAEIMRERFGRSLVHYPSRPADPQSLLARLRTWWRGVPS